MLGTAQLGQWLPLSVACHNAAGSPTLPDDAPIAEVWNDAGKVGAYRLPIADRSQTTGFFQLLLQLGSAFAAGRHRVLFRWTVGAYAGLLVEYFTVTQGGDARGAVVSMGYFERPQARYLLQLTDGGVRIFGKNPTV